MCEWGNESIVSVLVPSELSHTGEAYQKNVGIDARIAGIVDALNVGGVRTTQSCCGHGKVPGEIWLADGRVLQIVGLSMLTPVGPSVGEQEPPRDTDAPCLPAAPLTVPQTP